MVENNYGKVLCDKIMELRKIANMTQEALAEKLGITSQAVSKWENNISCPDITMLPQIAKIFEVSIDDLFVYSMDAESPKPATVTIPWEDDDKIRAVVYIGRKLMMQPIEGAREFTFEYKGEAKGIITYFPITCGDVAGDIHANGNVVCQDVGGDVNSNGNITSGDIEGDVSANGNITSTDIEGDVQANGNITCADIEGDATARGNISAADINGDVSASVVKCKEINGNVFTKELKG